MSRDSTNDAEVLAHSADAAGLMIASADDRAAMSAALNALIPPELADTELAKMLVSAIEVGGSVIRLSERHPEHPPTPRAILQALIDSCRTDPAA